MAEYTLKSEILPLRGTSNALKQKNPLLKNGQMGVETDTGLMKIGNGKFTWNQLDYYPNLNVQISDLRPKIDEPETLSNLEEGDTTKRLFGKIRKVFSILKTVAFTGSYSDLINTPDLKPVATTGNYADLQNKPVLANVATSGEYNDLLNKPNLSTVATSGSYNDLLNRPNLSTVATTGSYNDLSNRPNLSTVATTGKYSDLSGTPNLSTVATSGNYNDLSNRPNLVAIATSGNYNDLKNLPPIGYNIYGGGTSEDDNTTELKLFMFSDIKNRGIYYVTYSRIQLKLSTTQSAGLGSFTPKIFIVRTGGLTTDAFGSFPAINTTERHVTLINEGVNYFYIEDDYQYIAFRFSRNQKIPRKFKCELFMTCKPVYR